VQLCPLFGAVLYQFAVGHKCKIGAVSAHGEIASE
jgi:hypothetical protein